jgi:hypothetical protein
MFKMTNREPKTLTIVHDQDKSIFVTIVVESAQSVISHSIVSYTSSDALTLTRPEQISSLDEISEWIKSAHTYKQTRTPQQAFEQLMQLNKATAHPNSTIDYQFRNFMWSGNGKLCADATISCGNKDLENAARDTYDRTNPIESRNHAIRAEYSAFAHSKKKLTDTEKMAWMTSICSFVGAGVAAWSAMIMLGW